MKAKLSYMQRDGRRPSFIAVSLGAGCVISVVVSWSLALQARLDKTVDTDGSAWPQPQLLPNDAPLPTREIHCEEFGRSEKCISTHASREPDFTRVWIMNVYSKGWPFRAMYSISTVVRDLGGTTTKDFYCLMPSWVPPWMNNGSRIRFPLHPLWPGLAGDTAFYGVGVWIGLVGGLALRRTRRRWAGRCVWCNYDLRGLSPIRRDEITCPECGHHSNAL